MKIVDFKTFAGLPAGTIFSYYQPCICTGFHRKGDTLYYDGSAGDFLERSLIAECMNGDHPAVDDAECRWAMYDYDQQFAVYETEDIQIIREVLGE